MATTVDTLLVRIEADMADLRRDVQRATRAVEEQTGKMSAAFKRLGGVIASIGGAYAFGSFIQSTIQTGAQVEGLKVQLDALLGSAEEGGKAFDKMAQFASRVPFSLEDIQSASGSLAAASKDADQLGELLQITGNIAAQFNIPFDQAAENVQRSLSAGAASADLFQQKGVNAFMGLQAGVSYSSKETAEVLIKYFGTGGTSDGAMDNFAKTTGGALSMFGDAMFNLRKTIAESGLNEGFVDLVNVITDMLNQSGGLARAIGETLGAAFSGLADILRFVSMIGDDVAKVFLSILNVAATVGSLLMEAFGPQITAVLDILNRAFVAVKDNLELILIAAAAYIALGVGTNLIATARAAVSLATALNAVALVQRVLNSVTRRGIGTWAIILAIFGEITGATDGVKEKIASFATDLYSKLPEDLKGTFEAAGEEFKGAAQAITDAYDAVYKNEPAQALFGGDPRNEAEKTAEAVKIIQDALANQGGAAAGAAKAFNKVKTAVQNLQPEQVKLKAQIDAITAALPMMDAALKAQAEDALVILQQKLAETEPFYASYKDAVLSMSSQISNAFADMLVNGKFNMDSLKDVFKNFVKMMIAKALELYVFNRLIGSIFGIPMQRTSAGAYIPMAASGGSTTSGRATIVGERGPELFVPHTAGTIMNSNNTRSVMGGGAGPTIVQNINFATGIQGTVRAEVMNMLPLIAEQSKAAVADGVRRGGKYKGAFA